MRPYRCVALPCTGEALPAQHALCDSIAYFGVATSRENGQPFILFGHLLTNPEGLYTLLHLSLHPGLVAAYNSDKHGCH